jgi:MFS family permease
VPRARERLAALLAVPAERDARIFAVAAVVDALGNGLFLPVTALFFVKVAELPTAKVGLGLSITGFFAMLGPVLSGPPVDRWGGRRTVLVLNALRALCYGAYPFVRGFWPFVAVVAVTGVADTMARPALQALVATLTDERDRMTTMAFVRSVRNIGYGAGGLLVTAALALGGKGPYVALVVGDAVTFVVAGALLLRVRDVRVPLPEGPRTGYATVLRDRRFVALTALHGVLSLHLSILLIGFPLWIDQRTNAPAAMAGVVFTMNSILVVLLQVPFSRNAVTVAQGGRAMLRSGLALGVTCVLLALTPGLPAYAAVALLLVIGVVECAAEMWEAAGGWAVSLGLAPEAARGRYLGVWLLGFSVHDIGGPLVMAWVVVSAGRLGWLAVGAVCVVAGAAAARLSASAAGDAEEPLPEGFDALDDRVDDRDLAPGQPG